MTRILISGDNFVTIGVLIDAVTRHCPDLEQRTLHNAWPLEPMEDIGTVHEAQGDADALIAALQGCELAISHTQPFTDRVFDACPDLRMVTIGRGGPLNVDVDAAAKAGVLVSCTPARNANATTEHTLAMILGAVRQISQRHGELVGGQWRSDYYLYDNVGPEIHGSTVGVIGAGAIGSRVATILQAMGARILVFDPLLPLDRLPAGVERVGTLNELLTRSSIVTIHARATAENAGMIGADELASMPAGSVLVNCARGSLLDYDALCDALDAGHLYAAACDVLPHEPLPADSRLLTTPRLTLTPHLAGASKQAAHIAADIGAADLARYLAGERPRHLVNPQVWGSNRRPA